MPGRGFTSATRLPGRDLIATGSVDGMPARRVATLVMALALVALGACDGGGGDESKSSPAPKRSTTSGPVIPVGRTEVAGVSGTGRSRSRAAFPVRTGPSTVSTS